MADKVAAHDTAPKREKNRMRGKNKALSRYLRKKRENVVDPNRIAVKAKMERMRKEQQDARKRQAAAGRAEDSSSALDMFNKRS